MMMRSWWGRRALLSALAPTLFSVAGPLAAQSIHEAVQAGDLARVEAFLAERPELLEEPNARGSTPLAAALAGGDVEMAAFLLGVGADPYNQAGRLTPLDLAFYTDCRQGGTERVAFLEDHGVPLDPDAPVLGRPKLLLAAPLGNVEMVHLLLERGADASVSGPRGMTPLGDAARNARLELVDLLLEAGADPNAPALMGTSPLSWAVQRGHADVVASLLGGGGDAGHVDPSSGRSLLHEAATYGHLDITEALLRGGASVRAVDPSGRTPLYFAARYGHSAVAESLLAAGARRAEITVEHRTPSHRLAGTVAEGEGAGWFLAHRGMALKTAHHLLVFDAEEFRVTRPAEPGLANGFLVPSEIGGQDMVAFYSAYHGYVDEPAYVHTIADSVKSAAFVHLADDEFRGADQAVYLGPREAHVVGGVPFTTVGTMEGMPTLGYLLEVDGLTVFYQGFAADELAFYESELASLGSAGKGVDLAFLAIPDAGVEAAEDYLRIALRVLEPKAVALHTPPLQFRILPRAAELLGALGFQGNIYFPEHPGDAFQVYGGHD
jgi:ankyrin repeat protein